MKAVCVYAAPTQGGTLRMPPARALGERLAADGLALVYGGGNVGLMGILADAVLAGGGEVIGVIPQQLVDWEVAHRGLTRLEVVDSMHARKARMFELADAFVALPGGFGTMEEIFEMLTWRQLGIGEKPCAFLDVDGFYAPLIGMIDRMSRSASCTRSTRRPLARQRHRRDAGLDARIPARPGRQVDRREAPRLAQAAPRRDLRRSP